MDRTRVEYSASQRGKVYPRHLRKVVGAAEDFLGLIKAGPRAPDSESRFLQLYGRI